MDLSEDEGPGVQAGGDSDDNASVRSVASNTGSNPASGGGSPPQSPAGSLGADRSEDEIHISEGEASVDEGGGVGDGGGGGGGGNESDAEAATDGVENENVEVVEGNPSSVTVESRRADQDESLPELSIDSGDEESETRLTNSKENDDDDDEEDAAGTGSEDEGGDVEDKGETENEDVDEEDRKETAARRSKKARIIDSDDEGSDTGAKSSKSDSDDERKDDEQDKNESSTRKSAKISDDDSDADESDSEKPDYGDLIANIFGESDDEEEFEGFGEEEIEAVRKKKEKLMKAAKGLTEGEGDKSEDEVEEEEEAYEKNESEAEDEMSEEAIAAHSDETKVTGQPVHTAQDADSEDDDDDRKMHENFISDFDLMMQKKKEENSRRRKRRDVDIINDSDDLIAEIITQMRQAADEDRMLNKQRKTATKKLKILPLVTSQLKKQDLKMAFLDQGVLNVIADWLAPLPDKSLPHLQIREGMLKQLQEFPSIDQSLLKSSGIGRVLMYLYKHPKETKENKEKAGKLITEWARPIFNVTTDYHSLTKEEREQRDFEHVPKKKKLKEQAVEKEEVPEKKDIDRALSGEGIKLRPGDKGWVGRARVPMPSNKDYVVRPKWNVEMEIGRSVSKKPINRFERHMRSLQEKKRMSKGQRAVTISIEGRKMAI